CARDGGVGGIQLYALDSW
nr:immunoglobulin heavy chain junction region [Macaca mulatta]